MKTFQIKSKLYDKNISIPDEVEFDKDAHALVIYAIAKGLSDANALDNYLEIGVSRGATFNLVAPLVKKIAYAVDKDPKCYRYIDGNKNLSWHRLTSTNFFKLNRNILFGLIFIDATHTHSKSLRDFILAADQLNDNGLILMHDTYPQSEKYTTSKHSGNVFKAIIYLRKNFYHKYEIVTLPFYSGITIIRKAHKHIMWKNK